MKAAASALGVPYSRIRAAKGAGCEAFRANGSIHEDGLKAWLKSNPVKKKAVGKKTSPAKLGKTGAGEALKRLEMAEAEAHKNFVDAQNDPESDDTEVTAKRKAWRDLAGSLLSYETKVESSKRDAGEIIPKGEVIEMAKSLLMWTNSAISDVLHNCTPRLAGCSTSREFASIIDPAMREALPIALNYAQRANKLPSWLAEAAIKSAPTDRSFDAMILQSIVKNVKLTKAEKTAIEKILKKLK